MTLSALLQGIIEIKPEADRTITGMSLDSREIHSGDLFLACTGLSVEGARFIDAAISNGAVAVLWEAQPGIQSIPLAYRSKPNGEAVPVIAVTKLSQQVGILADRFYGQPSRALFVSGVTGTNGKTSVSQFLAHTQNADAPAGVIGTLGHGLYEHLEMGRHTTPDAVTVHRWLAELREQGAASVAMEVSSHALHQGRVNGVTFDCAVFTNLSRDHLDYHGDMQSYAEAKAGLFNMPGLRYAVINSDDPTARELLVSLPDNLSVLLYGLEAEHQPDVMGKCLSLSSDGIDVEVVTPHGKGQFHSRLLGRFNISNLLAVLAVLLLSGIPLQGALARLATVKPVAGRMETFGGDDKPLVVVDYAHTPDALEQVLKALREHTEAKIWCVFGCGGDRDAGKRPLMGEIAEAFADVVILTNDNPRSEDPEQILIAIQRGMRNPEQAQTLPDRRQAIAMAISQARSGDVVLVAGKGHETWQQVGEEKIPFSDIDEVESQLDVWT
ncbi:MAG: UDP-N-acetylmuramoyl-L-alanyl-D-glutamate--2,6-diaminopimelate ligase [Halobacteria archaeon]|nr:UDP-N-acetylmuramoyl-L-alanyl-D-glutamate--2,6-diaminopimelate ligase [Halobacteria archaeon]